MNHLTRRLSLTLLALTTLSASRLYADGGIESLGSARFTVITPQLIRMEYAPDKKFVDAASWFARNRDARNANYQVQRDGDTLTLDTPEIHLVYINDGKPFSATNLHTELKTMSAAHTWHPGDEQTQNLSGAFHGLDRIRAAIPLPPGLISRDGWYLLDDSKSPLATSDWFEERPHTAKLDWYFFGYGLDYKSALKSLTTISGDIPLPRKSVMGAWYSRNWPYKQEEFKQIVEEYHQNDFPLDNIVMDYGWHIKGWTGYTWNAERIPNPTELLQWFHKQGLAVTLNDHPDFSVQPEESMYADFMKAMGKDPASKETLPFDGGDKHFFDTFWQFTHTPLMQEGVDFWWLDWGKPKVTSLPSLEGLDMMNDYYFKATDRDGKRGQSFSRWAGWGDQRNPIHFSGDADSNWAMLAFEIPFTATSANTGCFFWSHDTGGYRGGRNEEAYSRWVQFSALSATLRSHSAGDPAMDRRPWKYPTWATDSMRDSFHLRAQIIPYVYTSAAQAAKTSYPFVRSMYLEHPSEEAAYHNGQQYYFGDNMLVAPITAPGHGLNHLGWQHVWFPEGTWYQYFTGEKFTGPTDVIAAADINEFPLFVRAGVPIPEQHYSERPTSTPLTNLVLRCYPGLDGKSTASQLYEDDGLSDDYKHGGSATTELSYARNGNNITIRIAPVNGTYHNQPAARSYTLLLPATEQATITSPTDAKLSYDSVTSTNRIEIAPTDIHQQVVVQLTAPDADADQLRQRAQVHRLDGLIDKPFNKWTDADRANLTPGEASAVQAIQGAALMAINQNSTLYGKDIKLTYFDPTCKIPTPAILSYKSWSMPVTVSNGSTLDFTPAMHALSPESLVSQPGQETFWSLKLNDHAIAVTLDSAPLAYNMDNLALDAKPTANKGRPENAIDGFVDGAPTHPDFEWSLPNGLTTGWIKLTWPTAINATRVLLYDRPDLNNQVLAGKLTFSDGTSMNVDALPNDGKTPANITFPEKTVSWIRFEITRSSPSTKSTGLAEITVTDR